MSELGKLAVVVTRPPAQAEKWQRELQQCGARTFPLPVLAIVPVSDPAELQAVRERVLALADYHKVIFVSQNAVLQAMDWIDRYWPQLPVGPRYFAVGDTTAEVASSVGLHVAAAGQAMNSEALLALPPLQSVAGEKLLICRGVGGRTVLGDQLRQRGARVDYCELYHRQMPPDARARLPSLRTWWESMADAGRELVFAVHSGDSLHNLNQLADELSTALPGSPALHGTALLVPGERVAALARELGFRRILVAANATDKAMTQALAEAG